MMSAYQLIQGDCLDVMRTLPAGSVQCCVTSPPYYGLRDYGHDGQIGLEETPEAYIAKLVDVFREVRRLLKDDGVLWLNLGDSYNGSGGPGGWADNKQTDAFKGEFKKYTNPNRSVAGLKPKDLIGIPWMAAFALRADGWYLRSEIIWHKTAPMPESVEDRPTKAHEQLFLLAKRSSYFYDADAIRSPYQPNSLARVKSGWNGNNERDWPGGNHNNFNRYMGTEQGAEAAKRGANKRSVWTLNPEPYAGAHFATMPTKLIEPCILAGSAVGDTVLDPFNGSGTTGAVALKHGRRYIGIELNPAYIELAHRRILQAQPTLFEVQP